MPCTLLGRLLGTGKQAEVYEYGEGVLKLYRADAPKSSAFREAATLALVEGRGLPAPIVHEARLYDGRWGLAMTKAAGPCFGEVLTREPELAPARLEAMVRLQRRIHALPAPALPRLKARLARNIGRTSLLHDARKQALLAGLAAMPEGDRLCHGDFHPWNILGPPGAAVVVDWFDASRGPAPADVCRSFILMRPTLPALATAFVEAYAKASGEAQAAILAWLPFVAAARLAEGVPAEEADLLRLAGATMAA